MKQLVKRASLKEIEWTRHKILCPEWSEPIRQGNDFVVCTIAKLPLSSSPQWIHEIYGFLLAVFTFAIVFGAFAANVLYGAMRAVPKAQIETAVSFGERGMATNAKKFTRSAAWQ